MAFYRAASLRRPGQAPAGQLGRPRLNLHHPAASYVDEMFVFSDFVTAGLLRGSTLAPFSSTGNAAYAPFSALGAVGPVADFGVNSSDNSYVGGITTSYVPPVGVPFTVIAWFARTQSPGANSTKVMPLLTTVSAANKQNGFDIDVGNGYDGGSAIYGPHAASYAGGTSTAPTLVCNGTAGAQPFANATWSSIAASFGAVPSHDGTLRIGTYTNNQFAFVGRVGAVVVLTRVPAGHPAILSVVDDPFALLRSARPARNRAVAASAPPPAQRPRALLFGAVA